MDMEDEPNDNLDGLSPRTGSVKAIVEKFQTRDFDNNIQQVVHQEPNDNTNQLSSRTLSNVKRIVDKFEKTAKFGSLGFVVAWILLAPHCGIPRQPCH